MSEGDDVGAVVLHRGLDGLGSDGLLVGEADLGVVGNGLVGLLEAKNRNKEEAGARAREMGRVSGIIAYAEGHTEHK